MPSNFSELTPTISITGGELFPLMQNGKTKHIVVGNIPLSGFKNDNLYAFTSVVSSISANLQQQINDIDVVSGGNGFTPIAGTGMTVTAPSSASYLFSVSDYISKTNVALISAGIQTQINSLSNQTSAYSRISNIVADGGVLDQFNALNLLLSNGGNIKLPNGIIRVVIPTSGSYLSVMGDSRIESDGNTTIRIETNYSTTLLRPLGPRIKFSDIKFDVYPTASSTNVIFSWDYDDVTFTRCVFDGHTTTIGTIGTGTRSWTVQGILFGVNRDSSNLTVDDCEFTGLSFPILKSNTNPYTHSNIYFNRPICHNNFREDLSFNSPLGPMINVIVNSPFIYDMAGWKTNYTQLGLSFASIRNWSLNGGTIIAHGRNSQAIHIEEACDRWSISNVNIESWGGDGIQILSNNIGTGSQIAPVAGSITNCHARRMDIDAIPYNASTIYTYGDVVSGSNGTNYTYISGIDSSNNAPPNTTYWYPFSTTSYGCYHVFDGSLECVNRMVTANNTFYGYSIGLQTGTSQGIVSSSTLAEAVSIHDNISERCGTGFWFFETAIDAHDNFSKNCDVGIKGSRFHISNHVFQDCDLLWDATSRPCVLDEARIQWSKRDLIGSGEQTFTIAPTSSYDRINVESNLKIQDAGVMGVYWQRSSRFVANGVESDDWEFSSNVSGTWINPKIRMGSSNYEVVVTTSADVPQTVVSLTMRGLISIGV
jgi:hypothetical protein